MGLRRARWPVLSGAWLSVALLAGCASTGRPGTAGPPAGLAGADGSEPRRSLYRIGYQGPEGSGSLRLALFDLGSAGYQARASDTFGRGLWSLELAAETSIFVDHRRRLYCPSGRLMRIPELALGSLPLERLPDVLEGRLPADPAPTSSDPTDFVDPEGRRWTATRREGELASWTLWSEDRPLLWWRRDGGGGILSHREGAQFRWRRTVGERMADAPPALVIPESYDLAECADLTAGASLP